LILSLIFLLKKQNKKQDAARRDVMNSITNAAFGIVTSTATITTPIRNIDNAFASIIPDTEQDAKAIMSAIAMDGSTTTTSTFFGDLSTSPTSIYISQSAARDTIISARSTIQNTWYTYIDFNNWTPLKSSYNSLSPQIRNAATTIVNSNPGIPQLAPKRQAMIDALIQVQIILQSTNQNTWRGKTAILVDKMTAFINIAP
jgi:hypothetical protein